MLNAAATAADVYTDFSGFNSMRKLARQDESKALHQVAKQFEGLFLQMMLKTMRKASFGDPLFGSQQGSMYRDLYDQQLALSLSQADSSSGGRGQHQGQGGLGLAAMLERQLGKQYGKQLAGSVEQNNAATAGQGLRPPVRLPWSAAALAAAAHRAAAVHSAQATAPVNKSTDTVGAGDANIALPDGAAASPRPRSPEEFVRQLWPHAQRAARELGTQPEVLIAQAALETGWGQAIIHNGHGANSHNLFNIKADGRWDGERMQVNTLEYEDGVAVRRRAAFRAYDSYAESFRDYVDFLRSNPRYQQALQQAHDPKAFVEALHSAGYATDPAYAAKVWRVMHSDTFRDSIAGLDAPVSGGDTATVAALKNTQGGTLS